MPTSTVMGAQVAIDDIETMRNLAAPGALLRLARKQGVADKTTTIPLSVCGRAWLGVLVHTYSLWVKRGWMVS